MIRGLRPSGRRRPPADRSKFPEVLQPAGTGALRTWGADAEESEKHRECVGERKRALVNGVDPLRVRIYSIPSGWCIPLFTPST